MDDWNIPDNLCYNQYHEWVLVEADGDVRLGITDYAQKMLREVTFVYMPMKGLSVKRMETICTIESVKATSEIYSPLTGTIIRFNEKLRLTPRTINEDPYRNGWIVMIHPTDLGGELPELWNAEHYALFIKRLVKIDKNLLIYRWREIGEEANTTSPD